jgi:hypothetical protein
MRIQVNLVRGIVLEPPFSAGLYLAKQDTKTCRRAVIHLSTRCTWDCSENPPLECEHAISSALSRCGR